MKTTDIKLNHENPRSITDEALEKLKESIKRDPEFMELRPIVIDKNNVVLGGNQRLKAIRELGYEEIPENWVKKAENLTEEQYRRFILVDNAPEGMQGEWDYDKLTTDFDLDLLDNLGFDIEDIDLDEPAGGLTDDDEVPDVPDEPVTKTGDVWLLGKHKIVCGDSTDSVDVNSLLENNMPKIAFADPPYNIGFNYNKHKDKTDVEKYTTFCKNFYELCKCESVIITPGPRNMKVWFDIFDKIDIGWINWQDETQKADVGIWYKPNTRSGASCFHLRTSEPILFVGKFDRKRTTDFFQYSRKLDSELEEARKTSIKKNKHAPVKPVDLLVDLIESYTEEKDIVYEPFAGNGTTLIACQKTGRLLYGIEKDQAYVDVIVKRWQQFTGKNAILQSTGEHFNEVEKVDV